jgi:anti-sigma B factor antagonist
MEIREKREQDLYIIHLNGRFDASCAGNVEKRLNELINSHRLKLIVNLDQVSYISSAGLRVLLSVAKKIRRLGEGDIRLACLQPYVREVFEIAGFTSLFKIYGTEEEAIDSFL